MKKKIIIAVLMVMLLTSTLFVFAGCNDDDDDDGDFVVACAVKFKTTDGVDRGRYSTWKMLTEKFTENIYASASEYETTETKYIIADSAFSVHSFTEYFKTITSWLTENDIGRTVYHKEVSWGSRG